MFSFLFLLLIGHVFADYFLQTTRLAVYKRRNLAGLAAHAAIWASVICLVLVLKGFFSPWKFYFLFGTHFVIDWTKIRFFKTNLSKLHPVNVTDQLLHLATVLAVILYGS